MANSAPAPTDSAYYQHSKKVPLASRLSQHVRARMFQVFLNQFQPESHPALRVLDVGVTSDLTQAESNYFEKMYPYPQNITCVGTEDGSHLEVEYPGLTYQMVTPSKPLPFPDNAFDIVFSNAVIEHVGSRLQQANFARELTRVAKAFFITTPNRWFPVEHHTGLPLVHFLPPRVFRSAIKDTKYGYWSSESNLNILTAGEFKNLFEPDVDVTVKVIRLFGIGSNLIAFGTKRERRA